MGKQDPALVRTIIATCCQIPVAEVDVQAAVNVTRNWDSLAHLNIMMTVEKEFGLSLSTTEIAITTSYQSILELIRDAVRNHSR